MPCSYESNERQQTGLSSVDCASSGRRFSEVFASRCYCSRCACCSEDIFCQRKFCPAGSGSVSLRISQVFFSNKVRVVRARDRSLVSGIQIFATVDSLQQFLQLPRWRSSLAISGAEPSRHVSRKFSSVSQEQGGGAGLCPDENWKQGQQGNWVKGRISERKFVTPLQ